MPKRLRAYEAEGVAVTFDPNICIHAEECVRGLPEVTVTADRMLRLRAPFRIGSETGELLAVGEAISVRRG